MTITLPNAMDLSALHERLHAVAGHLTYRALGRATDHHPETVRRYMQGQSPSAEFLEAMCRSFDLNAQWLILGRGPLKRSEAKAQALREANPSELLGAIAEALEKLAERVDRLELFVQSLELRVRPPAEHDLTEDADGQASSQAGDPTDDSDAPAIPRADPVPRSKRVAGAVAKRPRSDAD